MFHANPVRENWLSWCVMKDGAFQQLPSAPTCAGEVVIDADALPNGFQPLTTLAGRRPAHLGDHVRRESSAAGTGSSSVSRSSECGKILSDPWFYVTEPV